jgi:hypothetical protein
MKGAIFFGGSIAAWAQKNETFYQIWLLATGSGFRTP